LVPGPDEIEPLSMSRIAAEAGDLPWSGDEREMAMRIAYAVGDASVLHDFACSDGAVACGVAALQGGAPLIADVRMVLTGIDRRRARRLGVAHLSRTSRSSARRPGDPGCPAGRERAWNNSSAHQAATGPSTGPTDCHDRRSV
jgi:precorrin isomerase